MENKPTERLKKELNILLPKVKNKSNILVTQKDLSILIK